MKHWILAVFLLIPSALLGAPAATAELKVGTKAPPFELLGTDGKLYTLSQFAGRQGVVLAWFPKAFTPG